MKRNDIEFHIKAKYSKNGEEEKEYFVNDKKVDEKTYKAMISEYADSEKVISGVPQILNIVVNSEAEKFAVQGIEDMAEDLGDMSVLERVQVIMQLMRQSYQMGAADAYEDIGLDCMKISARMLAGAEDLEENV